MAEAGYADGFDIKLFWTPDWGGELSADLALLVAQDLQAVGIRAEPVPVLVGDYATEQYALNAHSLIPEPGLYWWWANTVPDIASLWGMLHPPTAASSRRARPWIRACRSCTSSRRWSRIPSGGWR